MRKEGLANQILTGQIESNRKQDRTWHIKKKKPIYDVLLCTLLLHPHGVSSVYSQLLCNCFAYFPLYYFGLGSVIYTADSL